MCLPVRVRFINNKDEAKLETTWGFSYVSRFFVVITFLREHSYEVGIGWLPLFKVRRGLVGSCDLKDRRASIQQEESRASPYH